MRIHHLNCGTCCPMGGRLFDGVTPHLHGHIVCHCLLIETDEGLVLVDTGFGTEDVANRGARISPVFRALNNIQLRAEETAIVQIRALGFDPADVRHIILTHLDFDHAGGLEDFPEATVHVLAREKEAADLRRGGSMGQERYRLSQWDEVKRWELYEPQAGEAFFGFEAVRELRGLPPELAFVPLAGHTWGHAGIAVDTGADGWLLHAGDAYFFHGEIGAERPHCPPGMAGYQVMMQVDAKLRLENQARLRRLSIDRKDEIRIFCAHDSVEFEALAGVRS